MIELNADTITYAAAGTAAVLYLARLARRVVHKLDAIDEVTNRELNHNHGTSIKDDVHGLAVSIGELQRDRDAERRRFDIALELLAIKHPADAQMYLSLVRSKP